MRRPTCPMSVAFQVLLLAALLLLPQTGLATPARADEADEQWLRVVLEGRKVGHAHFRTLRTGGEVHTSQVIELSLGRAGVPVLMRIEERHEETAAGEPLAFFATSTLSGLTMSVSGRRRADGRFEVRSGRGDGEQGAVREIDWPSGALLAHGAELRLRNLGTRPAASTRIQLFQSLLQEAVAMDHTVIGPTWVDLPEGRLRLTEVRQVLALPDGEMVSRGWLDERLRLRRMTMDMLGQELEMIECDQACATAANQPAEILETALLTLPRPLTAGDRSRPMRLALRSERQPRDWPGIDGQRVLAIDAERWALHLRDPAGGDPVPPPVAADLARTDWLDHDDPDVRALLPSDLDGSPKAAMERLTGLVGRHIQHKTLAVGYASASDAARLREGDCTEHAVLLAALARAAGIPARVVTGLAYSTEFGGPAFVPHAWVAAWTGKSWQAFDAALPGQAQLRIAVHAGDGDPWRFYGGVEVLGDLAIEAIGALPTP
ncbi:MAG: transglutaminase domain-containing protein [Xanthomonadales bacterium]|nr:transglutaminase domain-containing protein [Xanthomonadales bacterium]